ncbi:ABC transporter ATP-binding protein [Nonomuraea longispora]|uniref:Spermidine/putrescine import ATP-binding protein PotA n=1 Tax=Nonomuraea longispora TaxID=1848320 RepID=A0A4R4NGM7_9ACTN|nr:ABC transporter ATP-binding protein [Nonomuraea longispora]TDC08408.1 ABC transporter ATP-binding protein [Nonomuraea longispora]
MSFLQLDDIVKKYPGAERPSVADFTLGIDQGEFVSLLGPSGCGKTTTLRMIAGLVEATSGRIHLDGKELTRTPVHQRGMGLVFQNYALFPHLNVARNVAFGLEMRRTSKAEAKRRVEEALDLVRLGHLSGRRIKQLSGGQQQRVALARALVIEPAVLLLDEPLSNLDAKLRDTMREEIRSIQRKLGITTVFVTHDQDEALAVSDRIVVMSEGVIEQVGTPEQIYEHPANRFVANFIGRANLFDAQITHTAGGVAELDVAGLGQMRAVDDQGAKGPATVLVRPHRMQVSKAAADDAHGTVETVVYVGDSIEYGVRVGDNTVSVQSVAGAAERLERGTTVRLSWQTEDALVLT